MPRAVLIRSPSSRWKPQPKNRILKKLNLLLAALAVGLSNFCSVAEDAPAKASQVPEATTYQIRNVKFQDLLRPKEANGATGTQIVLYSAQPWKCMTWRLQPAGESAFQLENLFTSKTFAAGADTTVPQPMVTQVPLAKDGGESPTWQFTQLDDGNYKIAESKSGKVLTAVKTAGESEAKIVVAPWQNSDAQKWQLEKIDPQQLTM